MERSFGRWSAGEAVEGEQVLLRPLALALAAVQERTAEAMRAGAPAIKRWGGRILILLGAWLIALGVFADFFSDIFHRLIAPPDLPGK